MAKLAISVTLERDNLLWLRGRARGMARASVSELLDQLVSEARTGSRLRGAPVRSVMGRVRISELDPNLDTADEAIRSLFVAKAPARRTARLARRGSSG
jgi:hypothetical protein